MAYNTAILQGNFVSTGAAQFIPLRSGVDWIEVFNQTTASAGAAVGTGYQFFWQRGMTNGRGFAYSNPAVPVMAQLAANTGFFYTDTSNVAYVFSPNVVGLIAAGANAQITSVAHGLIPGDIIRLLNLAAPVQPLSAIDWVVLTRVSADIFTIGTAASNVGVAANPGSSIVKISREGLYQPEDRVIVAMTQAANCAIKFAAPHNYHVGDEIRINVNSITNPAVAGYLKTTYGASPSLNPQASVVTIVDAQNITISLNTVAMPAFVFPLAASVPFTPSQTTPIGEDTAAVLLAGTALLADATHNIGVIGMTLASGVLSPAGVTNDQIFWKAGVSFSVINAF